MPNNQLYFIKLKSGVIFYIEKREGTLDKVKYKGESFIVVYSNNY